MTDLTNEFFLNYTLAELEKTKMDFNFKGSYVYEVQNLVERITELEKQVKGLKAREFSLGEY